MSKTCFRFQNVSNEVLLTWFENFKSFWSMCSGKGLKDIEHSMSIENLILGVYSVTVSYLIRCDSLLQNATDIITKCDSYFITKCDRSLLQNASDFLLQNATVITNYNNFITKRDGYYKMRQYNN